MFDKMEVIDATRTDPTEPFASTVQCFLQKPVTLNGMAYPETCVVQVDAGRWPEWFLQFTRSIRRLQTRKDPNYGFVSDRSSTLPLDAYVANDPGDGPYLMKRIYDAAKKAGWAVPAEIPTKYFSAYSKD